MIFFDYKRWYGRYNRHSFLQLCQNIIPSLRKYTSGNFIRRQNVRSAKNFTGNNIYSTRQRVSIGLIFHGWFIYIFGHEHEFTMWMAMIRKINVSSFYCKHRLCWASLETTIHWLRPFSWAATVTRLYNHKLLWYKLHNYYDHEYNEK